MGVHVILEIEPHGIEASAWAAAWDETVTMLEAWKPRLLGCALRDIQGRPVKVYARSIRREERDPAKVHWCVVGDRESLHTGETQCCYRDLSTYCKKPDSARIPDIIAATASPTPAPTGRPARVFGDKTQGRPYHFAMLAAAMIVEECFPHSAMVWGDIDRSQAERARDMALPLLGRALPLPVRVDATRLIARLRMTYDPEQVPDAFCRVFVGDLYERYTVALREFPGVLGAEPWKRSLLEFKDARSQGAVRLFIAWMNAGRDLYEAARFACVAPEGPKYPPQDFIAALAATWVGVPRAAREVMAPFRRPAGEPHSVVSLFGSMLLDMEAAGRHLKHDVASDAIAAALSEVFGRAAPDLLDRFWEQTAAIEKSLGERDKGVKSLVAQAEELGDDTTEALATLPSPADLGRQQRQWLRVVVFRVQEPLATLRGDPQMLPLRTDNQKAKTALAGLCAQFGPTLTDDAWDEILAEEDTEVIEWLCAVLRLDMSEIHWWEVRRALFENAGLRRYAIELGRDKQAMREVAEWLARVRETDQAVRDSGATPAPPRAQAKTLEPARAPKASQDGGN